MKISVIVPTYNRSGFLRELLASLTRQTYPMDQFEVIVVDDGSTDATGKVTKGSFPFTLRYFWQVNQGDAAARNLAAQRSRADILVFLDDDMLVEPDYLAYLLREHESVQKKIVVGTEYLWLANTNPLAQSSRPPSISKNGQTIVEHPFPFVFSRNMSLWREVYLSLGMMDDLGFSGSSIWCDVDFAYRAYRQGYQFLRSTRAICYHRDYVASSLANTKKRNWEAAYRAVVMFQRYPDLLPHIPMFHDKTPINLSQDPPLLLMRKLARPMASSRPALAMLENVINLLERQYPTANLLSLLRRWVIGGYIFQGYRAGLRDFGPVLSTTVTCENRL